MMNDVGGISPIDAFAINEVTKNLLAYLGQYTPAEVAGWFKQGKDLSVLIDFGPLTIPRLPFNLSLKAVRAYMASRDERFFEAIRMRLGACLQCVDPATGEHSMEVHHHLAAAGICPFLPVHSALLGKDSVREWYFENMIRVRDRLLADLDAAMRKGAKPSEQHGQDGGGSPGGAGGADRGGAPGGLLRQEVQQQHDHLSAAVPDIDY